MIKVSAGAVFHLRLHRCNLNTAMKTLQDQEYEVIVLEGSSDHSIYDLKVPKKFCLVIGSEHRGVRHAIRRSAEHLVKIPMRGKVESLNVSCALTAALAVMA